MQLERDEALSPCAERFGAYCRTGVTLITLLATLFAAACSKPSSTVSPTPAAKVVYVVVTPTQALREAEPTWTPGPELVPATPTAPPTAIAPPAPRPTIDLADIPSLERSSEPEPDSRHDQLVKCLSFSTSEVSEASWEGSQKRRVRVRARNMCGAGIESADSWFEITAVSNGSGATIGREQGRFQTPIGPYSSDAETFIEVDCPKNLPGGCRYDVAVWWAAGGGRKAHR